MTKGRPIVKTFYSFLILRSNEYYKPAMVLILNKYIQSVLESCPPQTTVMISTKQAPLTNKINEFTTTMKSLLSCF